MKVAPRCEELVKTDTVYRVTGSLCPFEPGSPLNQLSPACVQQRCGKNCLLTSINNHRGDNIKVCLHLDQILPLSQADRALAGLTRGSAGERRLYLPPTLRTNDNRWRLESGEICVVPLHPEKGAFFRKKNGPTSIPPCQSVTDAPFYLHSHSQWAHSLCIQWALCNCWKIHSPPIYGQYAQQKCLQVAYLQLKSEIEASWWCDDGTPPPV